MLYRAVAKSTYLGPDQLFMRQDTIRLPSNLPYVVDNLLEYLRPAHMPSRRHAVYASPTPQLALANASAGHLDRSEYIVCEVVLAKGVSRVVQLAVEDARYHPEVKWVLSSLAKMRAHERFDLDARKEAALLYAPGTSAEELLALRTNPIVREVLDLAEDGMSFWLPDSATNHYNEGSSGELFFELNPGASYRLVAFTEG